MNWRQDYRQLPKFVYIKYTSYNGWCLILVVVSWNTAIYNNAVNKCYRISQSSPCSVHLENDLAVTVDQLAMTVVYKASLSPHPLFSVPVPNSQHVNVMTATLFAILQQLLCFLYKITLNEILNKLHKSLICIWEKNKQLQSLVPSSMKELWSTSGIDFILKYAAPFYLQHPLHYST
jgi:hypothetical protein